MSDKWDLDRVERAAKAEGYEVERCAFALYTSGLRWCETGATVHDIEAEKARKALAAYDAIVARMARELPGDWREMPNDGSRNIYRNTLGTDVMIHPGHHRENARSLRELADWLDRQVKP